MCYSKLKRHDLLDRQVLDFDFDLDWDKCDYVENIPFNKDNHAEDLNVIHWNIRGLGGKVDSLKYFLENEAKKSVDVVSLNETWLTKESEKHCNFLNYELINKPRENKRGGGVGFLIHTDLPYRRRLDLENDSFTLEHAVIELKCRSKLLVCNMYRPPNSNVQTFLTEYESIIRKIMNEKYANLIVCIDHNLDLLKHDKHGPTRKFIELTTDLNLLPTITRPTRITHKSATLIDNIMVSEKPQINYKSGIIINDNSDHLPCYLTLPDETIHSHKVNSILKRKLNSKNKSAILQDLCSVPWYSLLEDKDANDAFEYFHQQLTSIIDRNAPLQRIKTKSQKNSLPWLSNAIKRSISTCKKLYKTSILAGATKQDEDKYRNYHRTLNRTKRLAKCNYFKTKCYDLKHNGAKLWRLISNTINKTNNKKQIIEKLQVENIEITRSEEIARAMGNYYSTIGLKLFNKVPDSSKSIESYINKIKNNTNSLYLTPTTTTEIEKLIAKLKNKPSSGHDQISNVMLKWLCPVVSGPLSIIFNKSLTEGVFPDTMKYSDIISLYKNKERYYCSNYRPISLLLTISKILEKVIYVRVYGFMQSTKQITDNQFGFRENHSCSDAIIDLCAEIIKNNERGLHTACIFLDLSKAFDTLSHTILLQKLERYGIRGITLDWFKSYLTGRKLRSKVAVSPGSTHCYSDYYDVTIGTPQGSCLGPLLFLIYINDLNLNLEYCRILLFADDTTIFCGHRNMNYLNWCLSEDLNTINDWFLANKLTLNLDKSHLLQFGKNTFPIKLNLNNVPITEPDSMKFLGVHLDKDLKWTHHVNCLVNKLKRNLHLLRMGKKLLDIKSLKLVYHAHFESHLLYGLPIWGSMCSKEQINRIRSVQIKALKFLRPSDSFVTSCKSLGILPVETLIELELLKIGYKLHNGLLPANVNKCLREDSNRNSLIRKHKYPTRSKADLYVPVYQKALYSGSFLVRSISLYSKLSHDLKSSINLFSFAARCKKDLMTRL